MLILIMYYSSNDKPSVKLNRSSTKIQIGLQKILSSSVIFQHYAKVQLPRIERNRISRRLHKFLLYHFSYRNTEFFYSAHLLARRIITSRYYNLSSNRSGKFDTVLKFLSVSIDNAEIRLLILSPRHASMRLFKHLFNERLVDFKIYVSDMKRFGGCDILF